MTISNFLCIEREREREREGERQIDRQREATKIDNMLLFIEPQQSEISP